MRRALSEFKLLGIRTNIPFHLRLMESPTFIAGRFDNAFLDTFSVASPEESAAQAQLAAIAAAAVAYHAQQVKSRTVVADRRVADSPWKVAGRRNAMGL